MPHAEILVLAGIALAIVVGGFAPGTPWDEVLFPAAGCGFALYMMTPVQWITPRPPLGWRIALPGVVILVAGSLLGLLVLQAGGWATLWARWAAARIGSSSVPTRRLAWTLFLSFPWIPHDFPSVGWFFRLSGAAATAKAFDWLGFPVNHEGTSLVVGGLPMEIAPACAGLGLLQAMLVAGSLLLILTYPTHRLFYVLMALLPVAAWGGNTLRMVVVTAAGLSAGPEFAEGLFHTWGGLAAIAAMVAVCVPVLWVLKTCIPDSGHP